MDVARSAPQPGYASCIIECKGVLPIGIYRVLAGNRVGEGFIRSTISSLAPLSISRFVTVTSLWRGLGNLGFTRDGVPCRPGQLFLTSLVNLLLHV